MMKGKAIIVFDKKIDLRWAYSHRWVFGGFYDIPCGSYAGKVQKILIYKDRRSIGAQSTTRLALK